MEVNTTGLVRDLLYAAIPIILFQVIIFITVKRRKSRILPELFTLVFGLYMVALFSATGLTLEHWIKTDVKLTDINFMPFKTISSVSAQSAAGQSFWTILANESILGNLLLFVPFGFLLPLIWPEKNECVGTIFSGFILSLFIEACQLFVGRSCDIDDLILNTLGAFAGYLVYALLHLILRPLTNLCVDKQGREHGDRIPFFMVLIAFVCVAGFGYLKYKGVMR